MTEEKKTETTALVKIAPSSDIEVIAFYNEAIKIRDYAEKRIIIIADDLKPATDDLSLIAKLKKALEDKRKEYVKPLQDHTKAINDAFKILIEPIEIADKITREKILAFQAKQNLIRQEQEEINRLRMEAAQKEMELKGEITEPVNLVEVAPPTPTHIRTDMGMVGQRMIRKYRIINFVLLPDQYKIENSALLNKVVKAGIPSIPGVEIYEEAALAVYTR